MFKVNIALRLCIVCGPDRHKTFFGNQRFVDSFFLNFYHKTDLQTFFVGDLLTWYSSKKLNCKSLEQKVQSVDESHNSQASSFCGLQNIEVACNIRAVSNTLRSTGISNKTCVTI